LVTQALLVLEALMFTWLRLIHQVICSGVKPMEAQATIMGGLPIKFLVDTS
jgi:hypothetical protein